MNHPPEDNDRSVEEILDTIGDPLARTILGAISRTPRSAHQLAAYLELAPSTVYRHLDTLRDYELVTGETHIAEDGNHYQVYACNFESTVILLEGDEYNVRIFRKENLPGRFNQLWDDLSRADASQPTDEE